MAAHKAILVTAIGQPVTLGTWSTPQPASNEVLVRVTVAALNPHDQKSRDWGLFVPSPPGILANDVAGVVTSVGSAVTKFKVGDRIFTYSRTFDPEYRQNGLQEYIIASENTSAKIPEGFSDHEAATIPVNICAPMVGLFDESALGIPAPWSQEARTFDYANEQILIVGGGSNCGRFAVQLAKLAGIGKIVTLGGNEEELKKFGATHVLDRHGGDEAVAERIRSVVGDDLINVFDAINPADKIYVSINALSSSKKGKVARLIPTHPAETAKVTEKKAGYEVKDVYGEPHLKTKTCEPFWENVEDYLKEGKIVPLPHVVEEGLDADKVNAVLDRYKNGERVVQTHFKISS